VFGISGFELLLILAFVLIIFGPDKLPQLAKTIGSAMSMFKSAQQDMEKVIKAEMLMGDTSKLDLTTMFSGSSSSTTPAATDSAAAAKPAASTAAASVWAATSEDDEEEEDEE